jgi:hypothetical protein
MARKSLSTGSSSCVVWLEEANAFALRITIEGSLAKCSAKAQKAMLRGGDLHKRLRYLIETFRHGGGNEH